MTTDALKRKIEKNNPGSAKAVRQDLAFQFSRHIELMRLKRSLTQKELAKKVGTVQSNIARAEAGYHIPTRLLERIIIALDFSLKIELRDER